MFPDLVRDDVFRLETRRLWLRWPEARDAAALAREAGRRDVAEKTFNLRHPLPEGAAAEFVLTARRANALGESLSLVVALKDEPAEAIGSIVSTPTSHDVQRLSFWLAHRRWGEGLMSEAVRAFADLGFGLTDAAAFEAYVLAAHSAASRVLTKAGFIQTKADRNPSSEKAGATQTDVFVLERRRWAGDHGKATADIQNAMSVARA